MSLDVVSDLLASLTIKPNYSRTLLNILGYVKKVIADERLNELQRLEHALQIIERVPIRCFLENVKIAKYLQKKNKPTFYEREDVKYLHKSCLAVSQNDAKFLITIHMLLMNYLGFLKKTPQNPLWVLDYPLKNGKVMNDAIREWQKGLIKLGTKSRGAISDWLRGIRLQGMTHKVYTAEEIEMFLHAMIRDSNYREDEKYYLTRWLLANGGQDMLRFMDFLLQHLHFSSTRQSLMKSESLDQIWKLDENGKICFNCDIAVYSTLNENQFVFIDYTRPTNNYDWVQNSDDSDAFEEASKFKKRLLRFKSHIVLCPEYYQSHDPEKNQSVYSIRVIPQIQSLRVIGYTDVLYPTHYQHDVRSILPNVAMTHCHPEVKR